MGKCSSKLERNEDSDSSFQGRGGKPAIRRSAATQDATASAKPSKDKVEKEDVAVVKSEEGAFRSGESSSQGSGLVRKRNSKPTGLGLTSSPEAAPASSLGHEEGIETFHDASEELGPPSVPASPSTRSPTSSKLESSIFSPSKDSSLATSPPGSGSNLDLASSQALSRVRLNSSSSLPPTRSPPEVPVPTLRPTLSQKVSEEAGPTEPSAVSSVSAPIAIPSISAAQEQAESAKVDSKTQLSAKEHETMKAFVELGDNWELVTRSPVSMIQAGKKGEPESFKTQQESRPVDKEAEKKMELDDSASKTTLIDASAREVAPVNPLFAIEKGKVHETSDASETTSGSLSPAALLRNEGYTVREEPLATELKIDKPASISSRSESAGSGDFEIIRGPEDEKSTPRSPSPQISETSQPEIVDSPGEVQTVVDKERYPQFVSTPAKEVSEKTRQKREQADIPQSISDSPRQAEQEFTRQKSVRQIVEEIERGAFSPTSAATLKKAPEAEAAQRDPTNAAIRKIDFPVEPISPPQEQSIEKEPGQTLPQHPKTVEDRPLKLAQDEVVEASFEPAAPQSELEKQKNHTTLEAPTSVQQEPMVEPDQEKETRVVSAEPVEADEVEKKPPVPALEPAEATEEKTRDIEPARQQASPLILAKGEDGSVPLEAAPESDSQKMDTPASVEEPNDVQQKAEDVEQKPPAAELEPAEARKDETSGIELPLETPTPPEEQVEEETPHPLFPPEPDREASPLILAKGQEESVPLEAAPESDSEKLETPASVEEPNAVPQEEEDVDEKPAVAELEPAEATKDETRDIQLPLETPTPPEEQVEEEAPHPLLPQEPDREASPLILAKEEEGPVPLEAAPEIDSEKVETPASVEEPNAVQQEEEDVDEKPAVSELHPAEATKDETRDIQLPLETPTPPEEQVEEEVPHPLLPQEPDRLQASPLILAKGQEESVPLEAAPESDSEKLETPASVEEPNAVQQEEEDVDEKPAVAELEPAQATKDETRDIQLPLKTPTPPEEQVEEEVPHPLLPQEPDRLEASPLILAKGQEESVPLEAAPESDSENMETPASVKEPNAVQQEEEDVEEKPALAALEPAEATKDETRDMQLPLEIPTPPEEQVEEAPHALLPQDPDRLEASPLISAKGEDGSDPLEVAHESDSEKVETPASVEEPNAVQQESEDAEQKPPAAELEPAEAKKDETSGMELPLETPTPPEEQVEEEAPHPLLPQEPDRLEASPLILAKGEEGPVPLEAAPEIDSEKMEIPARVEGPDAVQQEEEDAEEKPAVAELEPAEATKDETRDIELPLDTPTPPEDQVEEEAPHPLLPQEPDRLEASPWILEKEEGAAPLEAAPKSDPEKEDKPVGIEVLKPVDQESVLAPEPEEKLEVLEKERDTAGKIDQEPNVGKEAEVLEVEPDGETRELQEKVVDEEPTGPREVEKKTAVVESVSTEATHDKTREMELTPESSTAPEEPGLEETPAQTSRKEPQEEEADPLILVREEELAAPLDAAPQDSGKETELAAVEEPRAVKEESVVAPELEKAVDVDAKEPVRVAQADEEPGAMMEIEVVEGKPVDETRKLEPEVVDEEKIGPQSVEKVPPVGEMEQDKFTKDPTRELELSQLEISPAPEEPVEEKASSQVPPQDPEKAEVGPLILAKEEGADPLEAAAEGDQEQEAVEKPMALLEPAEATKEATKDETRERELALETPTSLEEPVVEGMPSQILPEVLEKLNAGPVILGKEEQVAAPIEAEEEGEKLEKVEKPVLEEPIVEPELEKDVEVAEKEFVPVAGGDLDPNVLEEPAETTKDETRETELPLETPTSPKEPIAGDEPSQVILEAAKKLDTDPMVLGKDEEARLEAEEEDEPYNEKDQPAVNEPLVEPELEKDVEAAQEESSPRVKTDRDPEVVKETEVAEGDPEDVKMHETREIGLPLETPISPDEPIVEEEVSVQDRPEDPEKFEDGPVILGKDGGLEAHAEAEVQGDPFQEKEPPAVEDLVVEPELEEVEVDANKLKPGVETDHEPDLVEGKPAEATMDESREIELPLETPSSLEEPIVKEMQSQGLSEEPEKLDVAGPVILGKEEEEAAPLADEVKGEPVAEVEQPDAKEVGVDEKDLIPRGEHEPEIARDPEVVEAKPVEAAKDKSRELELPSGTLISPKEPTVKEVPSQEEAGAPLVAEVEDEPVTEGEQPALEEPVGEPELEKEVKVDENESIPGVEVEHEPDGAEQREVVEGEPAEATKDEGREIEPPLETPIEKEVPSQVLPEAAENFDAGLVMLAKEEEVTSSLEANLGDQPGIAVKESADEEPVAEPELEEVAGAEEGLDADEKPHQYPGVVESETVDNSGEADREGGEEETVVPQAVEEPPVVELEPTKFAKDESREIDVPLESPTGPEEQSLEALQRESLPKDVENVDAGPMSLEKEEDPLEAASEIDSVEEKGNGAGDELLSAQEEPALDEPELKEVEVSEKKPITPEVEKEDKVLKEPEYVEFNPVKVPEEDTREIELPLEPISQTAEPEVEEETARPLKTAVEVEPENEESSLTVEKPTTVQKEPEDSLELEELKVAEREPITTEEAEKVQESLQEPDYVKEEPVEAIQEAPREVELPMEPISTPEEPALKEESSPLEPSRVDDDPLSLVREEVTAPLEEETQKNELETEAESSVVEEPRADLQGLGPNLEKELELISEEEEREVPLEAEPEGEPEKQDEPLSVEENIADLEEPEVTPQLKQEPITVAESDQESIVLKEPEDVEVEPVEAKKDDSEKIQFPSETMGKELEVAAKVEPEVVDEEEEEKAPLEVAPENDLVKEEKSQPVDKPVAAQEEPVTEPEVEQELDVVGKESISLEEVDEAPEPVKEQQVGKMEPVEARKDESREFELPFETGEQQVGKVEPVETRKDESREFELPFETRESILEEIPSQVVQQEPEEVQDDPKEEAVAAPLRAAPEIDLVKEEEPKSVEEPIPAQVESQVDPELEKGLEEAVKVDPEVVDEEEERTAHLEASPQGDPQNEELTPVEDPTAAPEETGNSQELEKEAEMAAEEPITVVESDLDRAAFKEPTVVEVEPAEAKKDETRDINLHFETPTAFEEPMLEDLHGQILEEEPKKTQADPINLASKEEVPAPMEAAPAIEPKNEEEPAGEEPISFQEDPGLPAELEKDLGFNAIGDREVVDEGAALSVAASEAYSVKEKGKPPMEESRAAQEEPAVNLELEKDFQVAVKAPITEAEVEKEQKDDGLMQVEPVEDPNEVTREVELPLESISTQAEPPVSTDGLQELESEPDHLQKEPKVVKDEEAAEIDAPEVEAKDLEDPTAVDESMAAEEGPVEAPQQEMREIELSSKPESTPAEAPSQTLKPEPEEVDAEPMKPVKEEMKAPFEKEVGSVADKEPVDGLQELESETHNVLKEPKVVHDEEEREDEVGANKEEEPTALEESMAVQDEPIELTKDETRDVNFPFEPVSTSAEPAEEETSQAVQQDQKEVDAERLQPVKENVAAPLEEETPQNEVEEEKGSVAVDEPMDGSHELEEEPDHLGKEPKVVDKEGGAEGDILEVEAKEAEEPAAVGESVAVQKPVKPEQTMEIDLPLDHLSTPAEPAVDEETSQTLQPDLQEVGAEPLTSVNEEVAVPLEEGKPQNEIEKDVESVAEPEPEAEQDHLEKELKVVDDQEGAAEVEGRDVEETNEEGPPGLEKTVVAPEEPLKAGKQETMEAKIPLQPISTPTQPALDDKVLQPDVKEVAAGHLKPVEEEVAAPLDVEKPQNELATDVGSVAVEEPMDASHELVASLDHLKKNPKANDQGDVVAEVDAPDAEEKKDEEQPAVEESVVVPQEPVEDHMEHTREIELPLETVGTLGEPEVETGTDHLEKEHERVLEEPLATEESMVVPDDRIEANNEVTREIELPLEPESAPAEPELAAEPDNLEIDLQLEAKKDEQPQAVEEELPVPEEPDEAEQTREIELPLDHVSTPSEPADEKTSQALQPDLQELHAEPFTSVDEEVGGPLQEGKPQHDTEKPVESIAVVEPMDDSQELDAEPDHLHKEVKSFGDEGTAELEALVMVEKKQDEPPAVDESRDVPPEPVPATDEETKEDEPLLEPGSLPAEPEQETELEHVQKDPEVVGDEEVASEGEGHVVEAKKGEEPAAVEESLPVPEEPVEADQTREIELPLDHMSTQAEPAVDEETSQAFQPDLQKLHAEPLTSVDADVVGPLEEAKPQGAIEKDMESVAVVEPMDDSQELDAEPDHLEKEVKSFDAEGAAELESPAMMEKKQDEPSAVDKSRAVPAEPVVATNEETNEVEPPLEPESLPAEPEQETEPENVEKALEVVTDQEVAGEGEAPIVEAKIGEEPAPVEESLPVPEEPLQDEQTREIELPLDQVSTPAKPVDEQTSQDLQPDLQELQSEPLTSVDEEVGGSLEEGKTDHEIEKDMESVAVVEPMYDSQELDAEPDHPEKEVKSFGDEGAPELEAPVMVEKKQDEPSEVHESRAVPTEPGVAIKEQIKEVEPPLEPESLPTEPEQETEMEHIDKGFEVVSDQEVAGEGVGEAPILEAKTGEKSPPVEEKLPVPEEPLEADQTRKIELPFDHVPTQADPAMDEETSQDFQPDLQELHAEPLTSVDADVVGPLEEGKPQDEIENYLESVAVVEPMDDSQELDADPDHLEKEVKSFDAEGAAELESPAMMEKKQDEPSAVDKSRAVPAERVVATNKETNEVDPPVVPESLPAEPEQETEPEDVEKALEVVSDQEVADEGEAPIVGVKTGEEPAPVEESLPVPEEPVEAEQTREIELPLDQVSTPAKPVDEQTSKDLRRDLQELQSEPLTSVDVEVGGPLEEGKPDHEIEKELKSVPVVEPTDDSQVLDAEPDHLGKEVKSFGDEGAPVMMEKEQDEPSEVDESRAVPTEAVVAIKEQTKEVEPPLELESLLTEPEQETETEPEHVEKALEVVSDEKVAGEGEAPIVEAKTGEEPAPVEESLPVLEEPVEAEQTRESELPLDQISTPAKPVDEQTSQDLQTDLQELHAEPLTSVDEESGGPLEEGKPDDEIEKDLESVAVVEPTDDSQELDAEPDHLEKEVKSFDAERAAELESPAMLEKKQDEPSAVDKSRAVPAEPVVSTNEETNEVEPPLVLESQPTEPEQETEMEHVDKALEVGSDQEVAGEGEGEGPILESKTGGKSPSVEQKLPVSEEPVEADQTREIELPLDAVSTQEEPAMDEETSQAFQPDLQELHAEPLTSVDEEVVGRLEEGKPQHEIEKDLESVAVVEPMDDPQELDAEPDHLEKEVKSFDAEGAAELESHVLLEKKQDEPSAVHESRAVPAEPVVATNEEINEVEPPLEPGSIPTEPEQEIELEHEEKALEVVCDQDVAGEGEGEAPVVEAKTGEEPEAVEESLPVSEEPVEASSETREDGLPREPISTPTELAVKKNSQPLEPDVKEVDDEHLKPVEEEVATPLEEIETVEEPKAVQEEWELSPLVEKDLEVVAEEPGMVEEGKKEQSVVYTEPVEETGEIQPDVFDEEPKAVQEQEKEPQAVELEPAETSKENIREIEVPFETPTSSEATTLTFVPSQVLPQKPQMSENDSLTVADEEEVSAPLEATADDDEVKQEKQPAVQEPPTAQDEPVVKSELLQELGVAAREPTSRAEADQDAEFLKEQELNELEPTGFRNEETREFELPETPTGIDEVSRQDQQGLGKMHADPKIVTKEEAVATPLVASPIVDLVKEEEQESVEESEPAQLESQVDPELEKELEVSAQMKQEVVDQEELGTAVLESSPKGKPNNEEEQEAAEEPVVAQQDLEISSELDKDAEVVEKESLTEAEVDKDPGIVEEPEVVEADPVESTKEKTREVQLPLGLISTPPEKAADDSRQTFPQEPKEAAFTTDLKKDREHMEDEGAAPLEAVPEVEPEKEEPLAVEKPMAVQEEPDVEPEEGVASLEALLESEQEKSEDPAAAVEERIAAQEESAVSPELEKEVEFSVKEPTTVAPELEEEVEIAANEPTKVADAETDPAAVKEPEVIKVEPVETTNEETREVEIPVDPLSTSTETGVEETSKDLSQEEVEPAEPSKEETKEMPKNINAEALKLVEEEAVPAPLEKEAPQHELKNEVESARVEEPAVGLEELELLQDLEKEPEVVDEEETGAAHIGSVFEAASKKDEEPGAMEEPVAVHDEQGVLQELEKEVEAAAKDQVTVGEADPEEVKVPQVGQVAENREIEPEVSKEEPTLPQDTELEQAEPTTDERREIEIPLETPSEREEASVEKKPSQEAEPEKVEAEPLKSEEVSLEAAAAAAEIEPEKDEKKTAVEVPLHFQEKSGVTARLDKEADVAAEEPVVAAEVEKETEVEPAEPQKEETREIHLLLETSLTPEKGLVEEDPGDVPLKAPEKLEVELLKLGEEEAEAPEIEPGKDEESTALQEPLEEQFSVEDDSAVSSDFEKVALPEQQSVSPELEKLPEAETQEIGELDKKSGDPFLQGMGLDQDVNFPTNGVSLEKKMQSELSADDMSSTNREAEPLLKALGLQSEVDTCMCASCLYRIFLLKEHSVKYPNLEESNDVEVNGLENSTASQVESKTHVDITGDGDNGKWICGLPVEPGVKDSDASQKVKLTDKQNSVKRLVGESENSLKGQETHPSNGNDPMLDESKDKPTDEPSRLEAVIPSIVPSGNLTTVY